MENSVTVRAETVDKAVKIGLTKLSLSQDQVSINVINEGKKGLFGFGKQDAIVEISAIEPQIDDTEKEVVVVEETESNHEVEAEIIHHVDSKEQVFDKEATEEVAEVVSNKANEQDKEDLQEKHEEVARYLETIIREYGAQADISVSASRNRVIFNIETDKEGLVIGKHGKMINALQILAQVRVFQYSRRNQTVILNIGNYRDRRAVILEQMAHRTAKEVLKTKRPVVLDPLPSYERKQIHAHLSQVEHITTHSEGRDPNRYLVVDYQP